MSAAENALSLAAAKLAQAAPTVWAEFVNAYANYASFVKDECIAAPAADLQKAQGSAQQSVRTLGVLTDCRTTAAKIVASQATTPRRP